MSIQVRSLVSQASYLAQQASEEFSEELDGTRSNQAVIKLNNILAQHNQDQLFPFSQVVVDHLVVTPKTSYSIGIDDSISPVIADLAYDRPEFINSIFCKSNSNSMAIPLTRIDLSDLIPIQTTGSGVPRYFATDGAYPLMNIHLNIAPSSGYTLQVMYNKSIPEVGINDTLQIPSFYADLVVCALARRLAVNMPADLLQSIDILYKEALQRVKNLNARSNNSPMIKQSYNSIESKMQRFYTGMN